MGKEEYDKKIDYMVNNLNKLTDSELSRLRRTTIEPMTDVRIFDIIGKIVKGVYVSWERKYVICAVLYSVSYHCNNKYDSEGKQNLGEIFRKIDLSEIRFKALLNTDSEDLLFRLRQVFKFIDSKVVSLDWKEIVKDIIRWDNPDKPVQMKWAKGYYGEEKGEE